MIKDAGDFHHKTVEIVNGGPVAKDPTMAREVARRLVEEVVELSLDCGLHPGEILVHVSDALHAEAIKQKTYPSTLIFGMAGGLPSEMVDVRICLEYLRYVVGMRADQLDTLEERKLRSVRVRAEAGEYMMVGRRIYKKDTGR